jgi:hypothetical protein
LAFLFFEPVRLKPTVALEKGERLPPGVYRRQARIDMDVLMRANGNLRESRESWMDGRLICSNSLAINFPRRIEIAIYSARERFDGLGGNDVNGIEKRRHGVSSTF